MDTTLAHTFLVICDVGSFVKASERLCVTQSTVSTRVKQLEDLFGQPLFVRTKAGASLTPAGTQFKPYAEKFLQTWEQAHHNVGLPQQFSSMLAIGVEFTLLERLMARWLAWCRDALPDTAIRIDVESASALSSMLLDGAVDLAVTCSPLQRSGMVVEKLMEDTLVLVSSDSATSGPWEDGYLFVDWGSRFRSEHNDAFPRVEAPAITVNYGPLAYQHIRRNGGSAYLPVRSVHADLAEDALHVVSGAPSFCRQIYVAYIEGSDSTRYRTAITGLRDVSETVETTDQKMIQPV
ncbi:MAG: LysR family transcriptional regulator [Rhodospirillales bacterium]|nr:LysR family transcriptional regulator [Rhodospirillales bacterium]MBO6787153.1 LysR family transcriptional regulator [Rhodospirillales bacterium]